MSRLGRKKVQRKCKIRGYTLEPDAVDEILSFASNFDDSAPDDDAIDLLLDFLEIQPRKDKETVHRLVTKLSRADAAIYDGDDDCVTSTSEPDWHILDAFKVPKFRYDPIKKSFYKHAGRLPIHGEASAKLALHKDRLLLLSQIISRHKEFSRPAFGSKSSDSGPRKISPIQSLIGQTGRRWVMGMISQLEDGHFYLEDLSSSVEIDLSNAQITAGFFVENTIVVAEGGMLLEGIFQLRLAKLDRTAANDNVVIPSDIWLDNEEAMGKLGTVLSAFEDEEFVPCLFVLMGNFCSRPCNLAFHSFSSLFFLTSVKTIVSSLDMQVAVWQARADDRSPSTGSRA